MDDGKPLFQGAAHADPTQRRVGAIGAHIAEGEKAAPPPAPPAKRSPITTHVLDTTRGRPAESIPVTLVGPGRHCSPLHLTYVAPSL